MDERIREKEQSCPDREIRWLRSCGKPRRSPALACRGPPCPRPRHPRRPASPSPAAPRDPVDATRRIPRDSFSSVGARLRRRPPLALPPGLSYSLSLQPTRHPLQLLLVSLDFVFLSPQKRIFMSLETLFILFPFYSWQPKWRLAHCGSPRNTCQASEVRECWQCRQGAEVGAGVDTHLLLFTASYFC